MHGPLEPTNESYAIAKIAGIRLAQSLRQQYDLDVICPMPSNVYGPGDHFEFERSHVVSALVRRFVEAKRNNAPSVTLWGTGSARRGRGWNCRGLNSRGCPSGGLPGGNVAKVAAVALFLFFPFSP